MKRILFLGMLIITIYGAAFAQVSPEQAVINANIQSNDIKTRSIELERVKRESYERHKGGEFTPEFPRIKNDFEQIQKINADILRVEIAKPQIDSELVLKSVAEIRHRAARLKSNLFPLDQRDKKETNENSQTAAPRDLKLLLNSLDIYINNFVHSSLFQNTSVVNLDDSVKAQKDLEKVIAISEQIKATIKD